MSNDSWNEYLLGCDPNEPNIFDMPESTTPLLSNADLGFVKELYTPEQVRDFYEQARTKDTSLLREGEQYMQHKNYCKGDWSPHQARCTCGLSQYMEKFKDRTK